MIFGLLVTIVETLYTALSGIITDTTDSLVTYSLVTRRIIETD